MFPNNYGFMPNQPNGFGFRGYGGYGVYGNNSRFPGYNAGGVYGRSFNPRFAGNGGFNPMFAGRGGFNPVFAGRGGFYGGNRGYGGLPVGYRGSGAYNYLGNGGGYGGYNAARAQYPTHGAYAGRGYGYGCYYDDEDSDSDESYESDYSDPRPRENFNRGQQSYYGRGPANYGQSSRPEPGRTYGRDRMQYATRNYEQPQRHAPTQQRQDFGPATPLHARGRNPAVAEPGLHTQRTDNRAPAFPPPPADTRLRDYERRTGRRLGAEPDSQGYFRSQGQLCRDI